MAGKFGLFSLCLTGCLLFVTAKTGARVDPQGGACILDIKKDLPTKFEPLYLKKVDGKHVEVLLPETEGNRGVIALRQGEEIVVVCPSAKGRNRLNPVGTVGSDAVCRAGTSLNVGGKAVESSQLECTARPEATTKVTKVTCGGGKGVIVELGFEVESGWVKVMEVCHNIQASETYYAHHTVHGAAIASKIIRAGGTRPSFSSGSKALYPGFNPNNAYQQKNQVDLFGKLLGPKAASLLDNRITFLARGHLAPDADFIYSALQFLTYFYVNAAPQWQGINAGNWLRVEENTRSAATALGGDLEIVTGTHGVLKLPSDKGVVREVRLQGDRLPVPELYWKVLRNTRDDSCIAFVATNNPFLEAPPAERLCKDICAAQNWPVLQDNLQRGFVYCCEYSDFKKAVPDMPNLKCKSVMKRPY